ncbi:MAG: response regulator transcription factor [Phycisphaerales bacterium]
MMTNTDSILWRVLSDDAHAAFAVVDYSLRVQSISRRASVLLSLAAPAGENVTLPDTTAGRTTTPRSETLRRAILDQTPAYAEETHEGVRYRVSYRPCPPTAPGASANLCVVLWTPIAALPIELIDAGSAPGNGSTSRRRTRYGGLNDTDVEVLRLIADGLTTAQIAERLSRSVKTIEWRRMAIGRKLNATNRVDLALLALRLGIIPLEPIREHAPRSALDAAKPPAAPKPAAPPQPGSHTSARRATPTLRPLASTGPSSRRAS